MKRFSTSILLILSWIPFFTGCNFIGSKTGSISLIYGAASLLSLVLLAGCIHIVRRKNFWFVTLFSSVLIVNIGYTLLSVSSVLEVALWANRVSYLGSVLLPLSMLMILLSVTNTPYKAFLPRILIGLAMVMFLIAASPGVLPLYYKEVSFAVVKGVSTLVKVYGPLHPLYLIYLIGYFIAMVAIILRAHSKKTIDTAAHAVILAIAVFVNIGVWLIEQLVTIDFEMLSISYIISELFLLGVHFVINEFHKMSQIVKHVESAQQYYEESITPDVMLETPVENEAITPERIAIFMDGLTTLTPSEKTLYDAYIARMTTKEIMASMNIKESTVKYHSRNLYGKLGVSTRKELLEFHKHIRSVKAILTQINNSTV